MRIKEIRAIGLSGATPPGGWSEELRPEYTVHTLVVVHTDEGLTGIGSVFTNAGLVQAALAVLEPLYAGENALEPERVSEKLHQHTFWLGRGGSLTHTISGIDIALWDILGKATGQPVGRLLGGRYRERVLPYASLLMRPAGAAGRSICSQIAARGFRAFKIGWGPFGRVSRRARRARSCAPRARRSAPDARLMVDAGGSDAFWPHGLKWALRTAEMLATLRRRLVRGGAAPRRPRRLSSRCGGKRLCPSRGGEVLTRRQAFPPWLEAGAFDVVQPDVTKVGGISEERRIGWMAQEHGVRFMPHGWNTAIGLAADLHLASAFPATDYVEYIDGSPYVDEIVAEPWQTRRRRHASHPGRPRPGRPPRSRRRRPLLRRETAIRTIN